MTDKISIHALVKRATFLKVISSKFKRISIHALVKRATTERRNLRRHNRNFNPRPRKEGDKIMAVRLII